MNPDRLKRLLKEVATGKTSPDKALEKLKTLPFEDLDFARLDHHRSLRSGLPEVVYCEGKSVKQIGQIIQRLAQAGSDVLATRMSEDLYKKLKKDLPARAVYHAQARALVIQKNKKPKKGRIAVVTAGTSDLPVAEEAAVTAETLGNRVDRIFDVGVAGLHRLLEHLETLRSARVVIVVAGMDGALVSVTGGLLERPVIGVPTSVGYGAAFAGLSPLLTMLNSCAAGVGVVNIDNGFGAACLAHKINQLGET